MEAGAGAEPRPENQDNQHMLEQPRRYFPDTWKATKEYLNPCASFPCFFWNSLVFSSCEEFLVFLSVFPFFSRDFRSSVGTTNPCFFCGFSCLFPKKARKGRTGITHKNITELIPKQFRFGNSSTKITE